MNRTALFLTLILQMGFVVSAALRQAQLRSLMRHLPILLQKQAFQAEFSRQSGESFFNALDFDPSSQHNYPVDVQVLKCEAEHGSSIAFPWRHLTSKTRISMRRGYFSHR